MTLVFFLLLLVPLILFHEMGHFLVARAVGVRVLTFSIGFGPKLVKIVRGGTEYAISAIPFGGYVKMLGEDPTEEIAERDRAAAFQTVALWRRTAIVLAGPVVNLILPLFILFFGSLLAEGRLVSSVLGSVEVGGPAWTAGLRAGDRITSIDGEPVASFNDLKRLISPRAGVPTPVTYERDGERIDVVLKPDTHRDMRFPELGLVETIGRIQVSPDAQAAIVDVAPGSPAWRAGLRPRDRITSFGGEHTPRFHDLTRAARSLAKAGSSSVKVSVLRPATPPAPRPEAEPKDGDAAPPFDAYATASGARTLEVGLDAPPPWTLATLGLDDADLVVASVLPGTPAEREAGLLPGDRILRLDGDEVPSFRAMLERLRKPYDDVIADPENRGRDPAEMTALLKGALARAHTVTVRRGEEGTRDLTFHLEVMKAETGRPRVSFGAEHATRGETPDLIDNPARFTHAAVGTWTKTAEVFEVTVLSIVGLARGHVPWKDVGGPIFIAQMAGKTREFGWGYFFEIMVWLSVNLGVLNLLPIPLFDGGHLLFFSIEAIKRSPVSLRTRQVAAYVGLSLIAMLFVVVMKNDVERLFRGFFN